MCQSCWLQCIERVQTRKQMRRITAKITIHPAPALKLPGARVAASVSITVSHRNAHMHCGHLQTHPPVECFTSTLAFAEHQNALHRAQEIPAPDQGAFEDTEVGTTPLVKDDSTNNGEKGAICVHTKVHPKSTSSKSAGLIVILRVTHLHSLPPSRIATRVLLRLQKFLAGSATTTVPWWQTPCSVEHLTHLPVLDQGIPLEERNPNNNGNTFNASHNIIQVIGLPLSWGDPPRA